MAGAPPLHLPGFTFYGEAGPMLHIPGLQHENKRLHILLRFSCFPSFHRKEGKPGSRGGSARVPVAEARPCAPKKGRAVAAKAKTATTIRAGVSTAKPHGSPGAQGFHKVPAAPQGASRLKWRRGQLCGIPPVGERSVCGMSGRPIAAAPWVFVEFIRMPHTGMSAPRMTVFSTNAEQTAQKH